ncbi:hypothetical protein GF340_05380 [Candidatus Peregrinibacteria bacterium]|nr:hypothetical protein [Candidatus Peregrinibacteria bacterium]
MAWQGNQGNNCAALTPHDAKISRVTLQFRNLIINFTIIMIPIVALTVLNHPNYSDTASKVTTSLTEKFPDNITLQNQMRVTLTLTQILPTGLVGAFAAAMLAFFISTNNTYIHSWGAIFVQDIFYPLRKKPLKIKQHLWALRLSMIGVASFVFFFGLLFPLKEFLIMFLTITGGVYLAGAGVVIIGGLYWKRGTTLAAWAAMITGTVISLGTMILRAAWPNIQFLVDKFGSQFPYNSQIMSFFAAFLAISLYIIISLLERKPNIDMDRLLHRGKYSNSEEVKQKAKKQKDFSKIWKLIGVNSNEFTLADKGLFIYYYSWSVFQTLSTVILFALAIFGFMSDLKWLLWWRITLIIFFTVGIIGVIWIGIGGFIDLRKMYKRLSVVKENVYDDGRVAGDHLLADEKQDPAEEF